MVLVCVTEPKGVARLPFFYGSPGGVFQLGQYNKNARQQKGYTLRTLAEKVGVNYSYLSKIENQKLEYPPKESVIRKMAQVLEQDKDQLSFLAGRIPHEFEPFLQTHYNKLPTLFQRLKTDPDFAQKVFQSVEAERCNTNG